MNKQIIYTLWSQRKKIAEVTTTAFVIGKGIIDFARKDGIGKVFALAELGLGIGAAAVNTGIADKVVSIAAERRAAADYRRYPPEEGYDPYEGFNPEGPDPYDEADDDGDDYDEDEDYDPEDYDVDEDGFDPNEFNEFVGSGECPEYIEAEEEDVSDDSEEAKE